MLLCLARFLGPAEFGVVAVAMAIVLVVEALFELPTTVALLRVPALTTDMLQTAFTISLARGIAIAILLILLAWPLAAFSGEKRLEILLPVLALAPAARGLASPRMVEYARAFNFRPDTVIELSAKVAALAISVTIAITTGSYWAIAAATISGPVVATCISYCIAPIRPKLTFSQWNYFSNIIGWNFFSQLCLAISWQIDRLLLPRLTSIVGFGQYAMAKQISEIPIQALTQPLIRPTMVALSTAGDNRSSRYLQLSHGIALVMFPVIGVAVLWPEVIVRLALGEEWLPAATWLKYMSAISLLDLPALLTGPLAMTMDKTRWLAIRTFCEMLIRVPLICVGAIFFGIIGAIAASGIATVLVTTIGLFIISKLSGIGIIAQVRNMLTPAVAFLAAGSVLHFSQPAIVAANGALSMVWLATPFLVLYFLTYCCLVILAWLIIGKPPGLEKYVFQKVFSVMRKDHFSHRDSSADKSDGKRTSS